MHVLLKIDGVRDVCKVWQGEGSKLVQNSVTYFMDDPSVWEMYSMVYLPVGNTATMILVLKSVPVVKEKLVMHRIMHEYFVIEYAYTLA